MLLFVFSHLSVWIVTRSAMIPSSKTDAVNFAEVEVIPTGGIAGSYLLMREGADADFVEDARVATEGITFTLMQISVWMQ